MTILIGTLLLERTFMSEVGLLSFPCSFEHSRKLFELNARSVNWTLSQWIHRIFLNSKRERVSMVLWRTKRCNRMNAEPNVSNTYLFFFHESHENTYRLELWGVFIVLHTLFSPPTVMYIEHKKWQTLMQALVWLAGCYKICCPSLMLWYRKFLLEMQPLIVL